MKTDKKDGIVKFEMGENDFKLVMSKDQQQYLKNIIDYLKTYQAMEIDEDNEIIDAAQHAVVDAIFSLPAPYRNLYLIKQFSHYKHVSELADDLCISKTFLCKEMRQLKNYIKTYVKQHVPEYIND